MKKIIILFTVMLFLCLNSMAESLKGNLEQDNFPDFLESVNLSEKQRAYIIKLRKEESEVIKPFVLDIYSKDEALKLLHNVKCDFSDLKCKERLRDDIEQREIERRELARKIELKKNYYNLRYRSVLTREQDIKVQKLIEEASYKEKVLKEREEKARKQAQKEKMKFWKKSK